MDGTNKHFHEYQKCIDSPIMNSLKFQVRPFYQKGSELDWAVTVMQSVFLLILMIRIRFTLGTEYCVWRYKKSKRSPGSVKLLWKKVFAIC